MLPRLRARRMMAGRTCVRCSLPLVPTPVAFLSDGHTTCRDVAHRFWPDDKDMAALFAHGGKP